MSQLVSTSPADTTGFIFNLWTEPWISVLAHDGTPKQVGIRDCLAQAHDLRVIVDTSPLVVAGLQRLLAAIAQDITRPTNITALGNLLQQGQFDVTSIDEFGDQFGHRFDLFSRDFPFLQTNDIDLAPAKTDRVKTVGYLFPEEPTATNINHFFHIFDRDYQYSPATAARGLVAIAPFATSGGAGIRPSINGVPPLYTLPVGDSLFDTLALSLVTPGFQPRIASPDDSPAWRRPPTVTRNHEVIGVGYLESLTFPARRVRLFPERSSGLDSRTGQWSDLLIRRMVFDQGHYRAKESEAWLDPFAAYRVTEKGPLPIRPQEGKTLWREYANLFHTTGTNVEAGAVTSTIYPPAVVLQVAALQERGFGPDSQWRFRCVGMRTDMKAKIFEWVDETLDVPPGILADPARQDEADEAIRRAEEWARRVAGIHQSVYGKGRKQHDAERSRMLTTFWTTLTGPFRAFVLEPTAQPADGSPLASWTRQVFDVAERALRAATDEAGDRGEALRQQAEALSMYRIARARKAKEWFA